MQGSPSALIIATRHGSVDNTTTNVTHNQIVSDGRSHRTHPPFAAAIRRRQ